MCLAIVTAGGSGVRTGYAVPKQFLTVNEKPIIIYTLENIQAVSSVENIVVVVPSGWQKFLEAYCRQFGITKVAQIVDGGNSRLESISNGIRGLEAIGVSDDMVVISDGNRPLIRPQLFEDAIQCAVKYGASLVVDASNDSLYWGMDKLQSDYPVEVTDILDRSHIFRGQCPECLKLSLLKDVYLRAANDNLGDMSTSSLLIHYNFKVMTIMGSSLNFKITTADDIELFKAYVSSNIFKEK